MASPALAVLASRHSRFLLRVRVSIPSIASEDNVEGVVCASLCVEASEMGKTRLFRSHSRATNHNP